MLMENSLQCNVANFKTIHKACHGIFPILVTDTLLIMSSQKSTIAEGKKAVNGISNADRENK